MGFCLYGNDIDEETSPIEAGLSWITSFEKEFVDKEYLLQQKKDGPSRKLMGFVMEERGIPRQGYLIRNEAGEVIGKVTSGSESISTGRFVGMGYVGTPYAIKGQRVSIEIRDRQMSARLVRPPFI
jgi:aminomethyltransferase